MRNLSYENEFCMQVHFHANQVIFIRLVLHKRTRKWPIKIIPQYSCITIQFKVLLFLHVIHCLAYFTAAGNSMWAGSKSENSVTLQSAKKLTSSQRFRNLVPVNVFFIIVWSKLRDLGGMATVSSTFPKLYFEGWILLLCNKWCYNNWGHRAYS